MAWRRQNSSIWWKVNSTWCLKISNNGGVKYHVMYSYYMIVVHKSKYLFYFSPKRPFYMSWFHLHCEWRDLNGTSF